MQIKVCKYYRYEVGVVFVPVLIALFVCQFNIQYDVVQILSIVIQKDFGVVPKVLAAVFLWVELVNQALLCRSFFHTRVLRSVVDTSGLRSLVKVELEHF